MPYCSASSLVVIVTLRLPPVCGMIFGLSPQCIQYTTSTAAFSTTFPPYNYSAFGFIVTESDLFQFCLRQRGRILLNLYTFLRTLQQVQSPELHCYFPAISSVTYHIFPVQRNLLHNSRNFHISSLPSHFFYSIVLLYIQFGACRLRRHTAEQPDRGIYLWTKVQKSENCVRRKRSA